MNVKLFIVMGISWIAEIISSFVNQYTNYSWREQVFYATDALNCLQGVLIFVLFVMKKRVYHALMKRLGLEKKKKGSSQGTSTLQDPLRVKMSASNSTLTSSFGVSLAPWSMKNQKYYSCYHIVHAYRIGHELRFVTRCLSYRNS